MPICVNEYELKVHVDCTWSTYTWICVSMLNPIGNSIWIASDTSSSAGGTERVCTPSVSPSDIYGRTPHGSGAETQNCIGCILFLDIVHSTHSSARCIQSHLCHCSNPHTHGRHHHRSTIWEMCQQTLHNCCQCSRQCIQLQHMNLDE